MDKPIVCNIDYELDEDAQPSVAPTKPQADVPVAVETNTEDKPMPTDPVANMPSLDNISGDDMREMMRYIKSLPRKQMMQMLQQLSRNGFGDVGAKDGQPQQKNHDEAKESYKRLMQQKRNMRSTKSALQNKARKNKTEQEKQTTN